MSPTVASFIDFSPLAIYPTSPAVKTSIFWGSGVNMPSSIMSLSTLLDIISIRVLLVRVPSVILTNATIPLYGSYFESKIRALSFWFLSPDGGGILVTIVSNNKGIPMPSLAETIKISSLENPNVVSNSLAIS